MRNLKGAINIWIISSESQNTIANEKDVDIYNSRAVPKRSGATYFDFDSLGVQEEALGRKVGAHLRDTHGKVHHLKTKEKARQAHTFKAQFRKDGWCRTYAGGVSYRCDVANSVRVGRCPGGSVCKHASGCCRRVIAVAML
jgi:hypothetical protein